MDQDANTRRIIEIQAKILRAEWPGTITREGQFIMRWQESSDLVIRPRFSTELPQGIPPHINLDSTDPMEPTYTAADVFRCGEIQATDPHCHRVGPVVRMAVSFVPTAEVSALLMERNNGVPSCEVVCVAVVHAMYRYRDQFGGAGEYNRAYFIFDGKTGNAVDRSVATIPEELNTDRERARDTFQMNRGQVNHTVDLFVGRLRRRDEKPPYPTLLPDELGMWYYYTTDYGHSILCVIPQAMPWYPSKAVVTDVAPYLAFVPVKQVLRTGYRVDNGGGGFVWCDVPYSQELGVISEPDDAEY